MRREPSSFSNFDFDRLRVNNANNIDVRVNKISLQEMHKQLFTEHMQKLLSISRIVGDILLKKSPFAWILALTSIAYK